MKTIYLAWRDPAKRWYPVGELTWTGASYRFRYVRGSEAAERDGGFRPLVAFHDFTRVYVSTELFPTFENRIPSPAHPDYSAYMEWLDVAKDSQDRMELLARSGGQRATDMFEVFPRAERDAQGRYVAHVFAHGLAHLPDSNKDRTLELRVGEELDLVREPTNPVDKLALRKHTRDGVHIGYVPRYLARDVGSLRDVVVTVERVNPPSVPIQFRVLCRVEAAWPAGFEPCAGDEFQPRTAPTIVSV